MIKITQDIYISTTKELNMILSGWECFDFLIFYIYKK